MSESIDYDYENEELIDINLKCSICNGTLMDPVVTGCHHSFCRLCLQKWVQTGKSTCPTCRKMVATKDLTPVTLLNFISMLDQILVKCKLCQQSNIQRGNFQDHIDKVCTKRIVICKANVNGCSWAGPREQLQNHFDTCLYLQTKSQQENKSKITHNQQNIFQHENINGNITLSQRNPPSQIIQRHTIGDRIRNRIINEGCINLHLFDEHIAPHDMLRMVSAFPNNTSLKTLELVQCSIHDISVMFLATSLAMHTHLQYLDLYGNLINDEGVKYLSNMLQLNRSLSVLKLGMNHITNEGLAILANTVIVLAFTQFSI
ncbi:unnamed protein product [Rotaria sp. Silwood2]|nr:unnamed protein product [Rotaria sp. Silwood2]